MAAKLAATVAAGSLFPDHNKAECGNVLWVSTNPSSQVRDRVYCARAELISYPAVDFLGPDVDDFGLPIRHLFADLRRVGQRVRLGTQVKLIVIDYLSDYLGHGDLAQDIERLGPALHGLQELAIDRGAAVLLPLQLPVRAQLDFTSATREIAKSVAINSVLIVERDSGSDTGILTGPHSGTERAGEHQFHVRPRWGHSEVKIPVIEWDALALPKKELGCRDATKVGVTGIPHTPSRI
jgi:hypothetical protein